MHSCYYLVRPSSPTVMMISLQSTSINLTWSQPPEDVVDYYQILYSFTVRSCKNYYQRGPIIRVNSSSREYNLTGLAENSDIYVWIYARNTAGSIRSNQISARTPTAGILNVTTL